MSIEISSNMLPPAVNNARGESSLSDEQKSMVSSILLEFEVDNLSQQDAQSIVVAFQDAGIRPGAELASVMEKAGFNAREVGQLAGVAPHPQNGDILAPQKPSRANIDQDALQLLQEILNSFDDLSNLTADEETELGSKQ